MKQITEGSILDFDGNSHEAPDPADVTDADAFAAVGHAARQASRAVAAAVVHLASGVAEARVPFTGVA